MGPRNFSAAGATISAWAALCLSGCAGLSSGPYLGEAPQRCELLSAPLAATEIGLPSGPVQITSAMLTGPSPLMVSERAPTPAGRIQPALPRYCKVLGRIAPLDAKAPPIEFEVNLPLNWNGRSLQYGGGGFNGARQAAGVGLDPGGQPGAARLQRPEGRACGHTRSVGHRRVADRAWRGAAGLCVERRGLEQLCPRRLQKGARRFRGADAPRLWPRPGAYVLHGQLRRRARGLDHGPALPE